MSDSSSLSNAEIQWDESGRPLSQQYQDVYFSKASGLEETHYVFLHNNHIPQRWKSLADNASFTIAETGFGTGLNFLCSWQSWRENAPEDAQLNYLSVEKHPLSLDDLTKSLELWPELEPLVQKLIAQYPVLCSGFHRLHFDEGRVALTLLLGEADQQFQRLEGKVDAWYLDGFAPAKNPDMWTPSLFSTMAEHSHQNTTFSTFTAAGIVKRGLIDEGFRVEKVAGFGHKRDMLRGRFDESDKKPSSIQKPWFNTPKPPSADPRQATIIGAGIAGCSAARALANRGYQVTVIDRHSDVAQEASGNDQGILYAKLPAVPTHASRIHLAGYLYSGQLLRQLLPEKESWSDCGLIQLALSEQEQKKHQKLIERGHYPPELVQAIDQEAASKLCGTTLSHSGLYFPQSGWINPPSLCRALMDHPRIQFRACTEVANIEQTEENEWHLSDGQGQTILKSKIVVVATAHHSRIFPQLQPIPLKSIRGQVSSLPQSDAPTINCVLCGDSYISPPWRDRYCFGATFNLREESSKLRKEDHLHNIDNTRRLAPELADNFSNIDQTLWQGRVGFRCTTPDYLPVVGPVADYCRYIEDFAALRQDAKAAIEAEPQYLPGLYCSLGHGSKGMITAPLAAELLASQINGDPLPLERELIHAIHPARFIIKDLIRRAI